jgi:uncharacterized protein YjbI with pentapeptide repeats
MKAEERPVYSNIVQNQLENGSAEVNYKYCIIKNPLNLHLPDMKLNKEVRFKDSIFDGPADFGNIIFLEDVVFENVTFSEVNFHGAKFRKNATFSRSHFNSDADFSNTVFNKNAAFDYSIFKRSADFWESQIEDANFLNSQFNAINFNGSKFMNSSIFDYSKFTGRTIFENANFINGTSMNNCVFHDYATFQNATFYNDAKFNKATFNDDCIFRYVKYGMRHGVGAFNLANFRKTADFENSFFGGDANFFNASFNKDAKFSFSNFSMKANFEESDFRGYANFGRSIFHRDALFRKARFREADFLRSQFMENADFSDAQFDKEAFFEESEFHGVLNLNKAKYDKLYIRMSDVNELKFNETAYKSMIENFKKLGFFDDANDCYYRFMIAYGYKKLPGLHYIVALDNKILYSWKNSRNVPTTPLGGLFLSFYYLFSWTLYGFGTRPEFTLIWSIILMLIFGLFWWYVQRENSDKKGDEYSWDNYDHKTSVKSDLNFKFHELINAVLLSGSIFLSGTKFFIDPPDIPEALEKVTPWVSRMFKLERFLGGVLSILFLIAIGSVIFSI